MQSFPTLPDDDFSRNNDKRFPALLIAILLHILFAIWLSHYQQVSKTAGQSTSRVLSVTLNQYVEHELSAPMTTDHFTGPASTGSNKLIPETDLPSSAVAVTSSEVTLRNDDSTSLKPTQSPASQQSSTSRQPTTSQQPLTSQQPPTVQHSSTAQQTADKAVPLMMLQEALDSFRNVIRSESSIKRTQPKTFSTEDFPKPLVTQQFDRPQQLAQVVHEKKVSVQSLANGMTYMKTVHANGTVSCAYQQEYKGDGNPPLWFSIPAGRCNHIK